MRGQQLSAMMIKIPHELKIKFLRQEGLTVIQDIQDIPTLSGQPVRTSMSMSATIDLDLGRRPYLFKSCLDWIKLIDTYFKTSYDACKIDIGEYIGLWPTGTDGCVVHFRLDQVDSTRKDWRDWFIHEEEYFYASK